MILKTSLKSNALKFSVFFIASLIFFTATETIANDSHYANNANIISSIKPIDSLVKNLTINTNITSDVIVDGSASPHDFSLKPSQASKINNAKILFYINKNFEGFLAKTIEQKGKTINFVEIANKNNFTLLKPRINATWLSHADENEHDEHNSHLEHHEIAAQSEHSDHNHNHSHNSTEFDFHIWLSVDNAKIISKIIASEIINNFPETKDVVNNNLVTLQNKLNNLKQQTLADLKPFKNSEYIMFHDAFQYFEKEYDLASVGSITIDPEITPSPKRIAKIKEFIQTKKQFCVFSEPQFDKKLVDAIIKDTNTKTNTLDESGASLDKGESLYFELIKQITQNLKACLS